MLFSSPTAHARRSGDDTTTPSSLCMNNHYIGPARSSLHYIPTRGHLRGDWLTDIYGEQAAATPARTERTTSRLSVCLRKALDETCLWFVNNTDVFSTEMLPPAVEIDRNMSTVCLRKALGETSLSMICKQHHRRLFAAPKCFLPLSVEIDIYVDMYG